MYIYLDLILFTISVNQDLKTLLYVIWVIFCMLAAGRGGAGQESLLPDYVDRLEGFTAVICG